MRFPFFRLNKSQPIRRSNKSQPIRKKLSQSDALISEVLERRQMLAADMTLYDVEFETMPANLSKLDANSYSLGWGQDGGSLETDWTSNNPVKTEVGDFLHRENIINSIDDFEEALKNQEVKEVSDDLIGLFYNQGENDQKDTLYRRNIQRAWAGSSDNLYTLLVLNQRFPGTLINNDGAQASTYKISNEVMQAMMRIVGFAFNGEGPASPTTGPIDGPDIPIPNDFNLGFAVFSTKHQDFITTNPAGDIVNWKGLDIEFYDRALL